MKSGIILFVVAIAAFSSCSTAYRSGQTPDDVYYSPARETDEYVAVQKQDDRRYNSGARYTSPDDHYLRMMVRNRYRWSAFDNYYYNDYAFMDWRYNTRPFGYYNPWSYNHFNNYWSWNSFYNPYCNNIVVVNPKTNPGGYRTVRNFNLNSYTNTAVSNRNTATRAKPAFRTPTNSRYNNTNSNNGQLGNSFRKVFSGNSNRESYRPTSSDRPVRTYSPSPSNSSSPSRSSSGGSSGSSSGGSSSGSRPGRG